MSESKKNRTNGSTRTAHGPKKAAKTWQRTLASVAVQILLTGLALVVFAYFHHVRPRDLKSENVQIARPGASVGERTAPVSRPTAEPTDALNEPDGSPSIDETAPVQTPTGGALAVTDIETVAVATPTTATATPAPYSPDMEERVGSFAVKYADKFSDGEVSAYMEDDVLHYVSPSLNVSISRHRVDETTSSGTYTNTIYVTDFYVKDITCLRSAFAHDKFAKGEYEWLSAIASRNGAVVAINGDFASMRDYGIVIRDGVLYRSAHSTFDACAINWDGSMVTYPSKEWTAELLLQNNAYQAWSFGPELLDSSGAPKTSFNTTNAVKKSNPRTAIGYFEPGHYCFVTVDGRTSYSRGVTLERLAQFMSELGCKQAYNLDGGESSSLWYRSEIISVPADGGRSIADAVYLTDEIR